MKKPHSYFAFLFIFIFSCASHKKTPDATTVTTTQKQDGKNNVVSVNSSGNNKSSGPGDQIIFEGNNNLFEIFQKNTAFFDQSRDVIIIKGNGNIIKLYNENIVDMGRMGADTLIIIGDHVRYVMCVKDEIILKRPAQSSGTIEIKNQEFNPSFLNEDLQENKEYLTKIKWLLDQIKNGDAHAYFELAEMYNYGLDGTPLATDKAIALYEYGVVKGDIQSIRRLGDIWTNGSFDKKADKIKGRYYYKIGAQLGDPYCMDELKSPQ